MSLMPLKRYSSSADSEKGNADILKRKIESLRSKEISSFFELVGDFPAKGEIFALWSIKQFNAFSIINAAIKQFNVLPVVYISSYNISRKTVLAFADLLAAGKIVQMNVFVSDVAKSMFPKSFDVLNEINSKYNQLNVHFTWNHSKIALFSTNNDNFFCCEGSGNFSYNARHEQYLLINDSNFYEFRRQCLVSMAASK